MEVEIRDVESQGEETPRQHEAQNQAAGRFSTTIPRTHRLPNKLRKHAQASLPQ